MATVTEETTWIEVGAVTDIPRLEARVVRREGGDIALFRNAEDEVFALLNRCPHKGGPLSEGIVYGMCCSTTATVPRSARLPA